MVMVIMNICLLLAYKIKVGSHLFMTMGIMLLLMVMVVMVLMNIYLLLAYKIKVGNHHYDYEGIGDINGH